MLAIEVLLFLAVGAIVSLDVAGLTAVRPDTYVGNRRDVITWAVRNGFWHAALLLIYGLAAVGLIDFALFASLAALIDALKDHAHPAVVNFLIETRDHFAVFFALATIAIVWRAYRRKIIENPLGGEEDKLDWQRRWLCWLMRRLRFSAAFIRKQLPSVAVAMDMLALAFLLKSLNLFAPEWVRDDGIAAVILRVVAISAIIFATVCAVTALTARVFRRQFGGLLAGGAGKRERRKALKYALIIIRLTEPLLIFYFISELVSYLVWHRMASSPLFFLGSALLVFSLIKSVSFARVAAAVEEMIESLEAGRGPQYVPG